MADPDRLERGAIARKREQKQREYHAQRTAGKILMALQTIDMVKEKLETSERALNRHDAVASIVLAALEYDYTQIPMPGDQ